MYSANGFQLTKDEFNYLIPALGIKRLLASQGRYYLITSNIEELEDILMRLGGLYNNYNDLANMVSYYCSKERSLNPYRRSINVHPIC